MKLPIWRGDTSDLKDPPADTLYSAVLRIQPISSSALQGVGGLLAALAGYAVALPVLAWLMLGVTWLARGRPATFAEYRAVALRFELIEGLVISHLAIASLIVLTMLVVRRIHHRHPKWLCSVQPGFRWRFAIACVLISVVVLNVVYWVSHAGTPFDWRPEPNALWWLLAILLTAPLQAAGEEFLFRGYLLQAAGAIGRNPWFAITVSALVFAMMHGTQDAALFIDRFGFGLLAGALVVLTGGIEAAVAAHAVNNVFAFGYAVLSGGISQARTMQESNWQTTGWNLLAYALVVLICWIAGLRMRIAQRTPEVA